MSQLLSGDYQLMQTILLSELCLRFRYYPKSQKNHRSIFILKQVNSFHLLAYTNQLSQLVLHSLTSFIKLFYRHSLWLMTIFCWDGVVGSSELELELSKLVLGGGLGVSASFGGNTTEGASRSFMSFNLPRSCGEVSRIVGFVSQDWDMRSSKPAGASSQGKGRVGLSPWSTFAKKSKFIKLGCFSSSSWKMVFHQFGSYLLFRRCS